MRDTAPVLARTLAASVQHRIAFGERAGQHVRRIGAGFGAEGEAPRLTGLHCASVNGFSLHANTATPAQLSSRLWYTYRKEDDVMKMLLCSCLITVTLGFSPVVALGDELSHRKAAEDLLLVLEVDKSLPKVIDQVVGNQVQHNPQLAPQREVLQRFLTTYLNWESVKEDTITAYTHAFTEPELKQLTEFYKTPLGKKANEKLPQLAFIAGQIGLRQAQAHETELRQMLSTAR